MTVDLKLTEHARSAPGDRPASIRATRGASARDGAAPRRRQQALRRDAGDRGRVVRGQARRDRRRHRPQRRGKIDAHPLPERAREARQRAHRGARRGHRAARRARVAQGPPARGHDLPALQPAVVQDRRRQCRASAQDRGKDAERAPRPGAVPAVARRPRGQGRRLIPRSYRAGKSSASASPARSRPTPRSSCPTKRPPRSIPKRPPPFSRCCAISTASSASPSFSSPTR